MYHLKISKNVKKPGILLVFCRINLCFAESTHSNLKDYLKNPPMQMMIFLLE